MQESSSVLVEGGDLVERWSYEIIKSTRSTKSNDDEALTTFAVQITHINQDGVIDETAHANALATLADARSSLDSLVRAFIEGNGFRWATQQPRNHIAPSSQQPSVGFLSNIKGRSSK